MEKQYSPKQVARALGVSEASLKRWCDKGLIASVKTAGGHRRLPKAAVMQFLRERGRPLAQPEILDLPSAVGQGEFTREKVKARMVEALQLGDAERFRCLALETYMGGMPLRELFDQFVSGCFREIGDRWAHGALEVYQERRAVEICMRLIRELQMMLPVVPANAPRAIGGTVLRDSYTLASMMVELSLREIGWEAQHYGVLLPFETLAAAVEREQPRLCWISVSWIEDRDLFLKAYSDFYERACQRSVRVVVGGRGLTEEVRGQMRYSSYCDTLEDLVSFAREARHSVNEEGSAV